jgi:hypothetical protein
MLAVEVVIDGSTKACSAGCGADWSLPATQRRARRALSRAFGKEVKLTFTDVTRNRSVALNYGRESRLPLLILDGSLRLAGEFDVRQLVDAVQTERELSGTG